MPNSVQHDQRLDTIPRLFHAQVKKSCDRIAMRHKKLGLWNEITWNQYLENVRIVAMGLLNLGAEKGNCVSILSENNPEWVYCDIAAQCIGCVPVGIYTTNSPEEVAYIIDHSESRVFFVENEEQLDKVLMVKNDLSMLQRVIVYDMKGLKHFSDPLVMSFDDFMELGKSELERDPHLFDNKWPQVKPEDTAIIVYTSGTTGLPKGAMLSHHNVTWTCRTLGEVNSVYETDEILSFLPLCHIAERSNTVFNALAFGLTVNFAESIETVPEDLREISPHIFFAVPRF